MLISVNHYVRLSSHHSAEIGNMLPLLHKQRHSDRANSGKQKWNSTPGAQTEALDSILVETSLELEFECLK